MSRAFSPFRKVAEATGPQSLLNAQKLSLAANTAVGTQVSVTDAVKVAGGTQDGVYSKRGRSNGRDYFILLGVATDLAVSQAKWNGADQWWITDSGDNLLYYSFSDVATPDLATNWKNASDDSPASITVTSPVLQQLTTPSSAQGGVAVMGGTQDGAWTDRGALVNGKKTFVLLGNDGSDNTIATIKWVLDLSGEGIGVAETPGFVIKGVDGTSIYGSTSDVATPNLATGWMDSNGDSVLITVTTITQGQLVSGWKLGDVTYQVNGNQNGRNLYSDVLGVAPNLGFDGAHWSDGTTTGTLNSAFPDIGTADPVASETNWSVVP